jgi:RND family efflux transporter MFP subunit
LVSQLEVDKAKGGYETALATEKHSQQLVDNAMIRAPFDGVVTDRWVDPGSLIQTGTSSQSAGARIARIINIRTIRFAVAIPERDAPSITVGSEAVVRFPDRAGKEYRGRVARYAWTVDPATRTMAAQIEFPNPEYEVRPGMYGTAEITIEKIGDALVVPSEAVLFSGKDRYVWVVDGDRARRVAVEVAKDDGVRAEIRKGLDGSGNIVLSGRQSLRDSAAVVVTGPGKS